MARKPASGKNLLASGNPESDDASFMHALEQAIEALELAYRSAKRMSVHRGQAAALILRCDEVLINVRDNAGMIKKSELISKAVDTVVSICLDIVKWSGYSTEQCWKESDAITQKLDEYDVGLKESLNLLRLSATLQEPKQPTEVKELIAQDEQKLTITREVEKWKAAGSRMSKTLLQAGASTPLSSESSFAVLKIAASACTIPALEPAISELELAYISAKKVAIYRGQTAALMLKCDKVLIAIRDNAEKVEKIRLDASINRIIDVIGSIRRDMVKWSNYSSWRCWWERHEYGDMLDEHAAALSRCIELLTLAVTIEVVSQVREVKDMVEEDQQNLKVICDQVDQIHSMVAGFHATRVSNAPGSARYIEATRGLIDLSINPAPYVLRPSNLDGEVTKISDYPLFCGLTYDTYKGLWLDTFFVAMKVLRGPASAGAARPQDVRRLERQIDLWRTMKHKHVLDLKGYCTINGNQVCLISPWMENRDVVTYLHNTSDANRFQLITDIAIGLEYLHSIHTFHGGLQTSKILVASEGHALLAGFGLSKLLKDGEQTFYTQSDGPVSEFRYQPPEVMSGQPLNTSCDVYSWAMCALEIMTGRQPFYYIEKIGRLIKAINEHQFPERRHYSSPALEQCIGLWDLLEACCHGDPTKRPPISQVLVSLDTIKSHGAA